MFGPEYFTVAGYLTDGGILCRECGDKAGLPVSDQIMQSEFNSGWEEGCYCDNCTAEIVAPYEWTCPQCDTVYYGEEALTAERQHYGRGWCGAEKCCDLNAGDEDFSE